MMDESIIEQEIVDMFSTIVEEKDVYTAGHSKRVAMYSCRLAEALGFNEEEQIKIYQAGLLHDIGKVLTPESILLKPRKFNRREYDIIKRHSADGEKMVNAITVFRPYAKIIRHHHERYDGGGYPDGLCGEEIPLYSRIMSIADAFDAMTTNRIYKARKNITQALEEIKQCAHKQFDPTLVPTAIKVFSSLKELVHIAQSPEYATIYEDRFAYFFKDSLTDMYSSEYLNYFLRDNKESKRFRCCYFVQLHHMQEYNQRFGWQLGDALIKEVALRIKALLNSGFIFRVFGDDFIVLNALHVKVDTKELLAKLGVGFELIKISIQHFDLEEATIDKWDYLENHLIHYEH